MYYVIIFNKQQAILSFSIRSTSDNKLKAKLIVPSLINNVGRIKMESQGAKIPIPRRRHRVRNVLLIKSLHSTLNIHNNKPKSKLNTCNL